MKRPIPFSTVAKQVGASILVDGEMAAVVRRDLPPTEDRLRLVARMRPRGMDNSVDIYELLLVGAGYDHMTDEDIATYKKTTQAIIAGKWDNAQQMLEGILPDDGPANYLRALLADHNTSPPSDWDGAINLLQE